MIEIKLELDMYFHPIAEEKDLIEKDSSQDKLFSEVKKSLERHGIKSGYTLGCFGDHETYGLFKRSGYWIVSFSERGKTEGVGIFTDVHNAVEFFLCIMLESNEDHFDWRSVFD